MVWTYLDIDTSVTMMHLIKVGSETVVMKITQSMANLHG